MIILRATADLLRVTTDASANILAHVSAIEADNATPPVIQDIVRVNTAAITTGTTTTILDCTTSNRRRNVKNVNLFNSHASTQSTVTVFHTDGTNSETLAVVILLAGESLVYTEGGLWLHYDSNGGVYPSVGNAASQAEQEAGTATDRFVSPGRQHFHPSAAKCWGKAPGAGTSLTVNYNVTSVTDTGTGRLTVNIGTDFSSADFAIFTEVQSVSSSLAVANVDDCRVANTSVTAGTFEIWNYDHTATTHVAQDPLQYFWGCFGDQA